MFTYIYFLLFFKIYQLANTFDNIRNDWTMGKWGEGENLELIYYKYINLKKYIFSNYSTSTLNVHFFL